MHRRNAICLGSSQRLCAGAALPLRHPNNERCGRRNAVIMSEQQRAELVHAVNALYPPPQANKSRRSRRRAKRPRRLSQPHSKRLSRRGAVCSATVSPAALRSLWTGESTSPSVSSSSTSPSTTTTPTTQSPRHQSSSSSSSSSSTSSPSRLVQRTVAILARALPPEFVGVTRRRLESFARLTLESYRDNPYHNAEHAVDVLEATARLLHNAGLSSELGDRDSFLLLLAALGHDAGHPGVSNDYLVQTSDELALLYNDTSVLEMHHASTLFGILRHPSVRMFEGLSRDDYMMCRALILHAVLHTDMARHASIVESLAKWHDGKLPADRLALAAAVLHAADISNVTGDMADMWADRVAAEFLAEGDLRRRQGLPVAAFMDSLRVRSPQTDVTLPFARFVAVPFFDALASAFPSTMPLRDGLAENVARWSAAAEKSSD